MIERAIRTTGQAVDKFQLTFSKDPFPGAFIELEWTRSDGSGNWYRWNEQKGWLCPALLRYFQEPPRRIYAKAEPVEGASAVAVTREELAFFERAVEAQDWSLAKDLLKELHKRFDA